MSKKIILFLSIVLISPSVLAFVQTKSNNGTDIKWNNNSFVIYHDSNYVLSGAGADSLDTILLNSLTQWNSNSNLSLTRVNANGPVSNRNDLYYDTTSAYFGSIPSLSGVLAVTAVTFVTATGEIKETDIVINSAKNFSNEKETTSPNNLTSFYMGDILTHELGHAVGLGHGQVQDSSMVYSVYRGQHTVAEDDQAGIFSIYPNSSNKGSITGKIIGGSAKIGVFGAHVMAISTTDGKVVSSTISDSDGSFSIKGLALNDTYYLYNTPANLINEFVPSSSPLPEYYTSAKRNFCATGSSYVGSFFQTCQNADQGFPQGIRLTTSEKIKNVGNVTIRCQLDVSSVYNSAKTSFLDLNSSISGRDIEQVEDTAYGETIVGYFTSTQKNANSPDVFHVDLSNLDSYSGKYLDVKIIGGNLFAPTRVDLVIENAAAVSMQSIYDDGDSDTSIDLGIFKNSTTDQNLKLDHHLKFPLSSTLSENNFTVTLTPYPLVFGMNLLGSNDNEWFFPVSSDLMKSTSFYMMIISITNASDQIVLPRAYSIVDNSTCSSEAINTYAVNPTTSGNSSVTVVKTTQKDSGLTCGSIAIVNSNDDDHNNTGNGPLSFTFGFMLIILIGHIVRRFFPAKY
jgi:hypothetical protein